MVLTLTTHHNWKIDAFNFNLAYLNGELGEDKEIFKYIWKSHLAMRPVQEMSSGCTNLRYIGIEYCAE
jgi:hypothetical protein